MAKDTGRLLNTAPGDAADIGSFANPLDFIAEDHMREREVCALIDRLVADRAIRTDGRRMMLAFLREQLPQHLADEEIDLFPLMLERCEPEEEIDKVIATLQSDHKHALADAPAIAALIETGDEDAILASDGARAQLTGFAGHARRHLILENAVILPIARARLTSGDLKTMRQHMLERRGHRGPQEIETC